VVLRQQSISQEKVNFFGQKRIASFLPRMEVYSRPLVYKLKESTYKQYKQFWKRALALTCRTCDPEQHIQFQHTLGSCQTTLPDSLLRIAAEMVTKPSLAPEQLDCICLDFFLSLQLLVRQKASLLAEDGVVQDPLDPLDEMPTGP
jgi:hypothetical protein